MDENMSHEENVFPNTSSTSAPAQDEDEQLGAQQIRHMLSENIATVTRLTALVTEMQVNCVRQEEEFAQTYNPKLFEEARRVLDKNEDQLNRIQEMLSRDE